MKSLSLPVSIVLIACFLRQTGCENFKLHGNTCDEALAVAAVLTYEYQNNAFKLQSLDNAVTNYIIIVAGGHKKESLPLPSSFYPPPKLWVDAIRSNHIPIVDFNRLNIGTNIVIDSMTEDRGVIFSIENLKWIANDQIEVSFFEYWGILNGCGSDYVVRKDKDNVWRVVKAKSMWLH